MLLLHPALDFFLLDFDVTVVHCSSSRASAQITRVPPCWAATAPMVACVSEVDALPVKPMADPTDPRTALGASEPAPPCWAPPVGVIVSAEGLSEPAPPCWAPLVGITVEEAKAFATGSCLGTLPELPPNVNVPTAACLVGGG